MKTRIPTLLLLLVSIVMGVYTSIHLKQALDAEHELRTQMGDLSLATTSDATASSNVVLLGEQSLRGALKVVLTTAHNDEAFLAVECIGFLLALGLLRRRTAKI